MEIFSFDLHPLRVDRQNIGKEERGNRYSFI